MNACLFLIPAVYEGATATEFAIAAETAEKSDANTLSIRPTLNAWTKRINSADHLVARNSRIDNARKDAFDSCRIRMADAARLNANSYLSGTGVPKRPSHQGELARLADFDSSIGGVHHTSLSLRARVES